LGVPLPVETGITLSAVALGATVALAIQPSGIGPTFDDRFDASGRRGESLLSRKFAPCIKSYSAWRDHLH
jgi:hypothetical protein